MAARTPSRSTAASSAGALRGEPEPSRCEFSAATQLCEGFRAMMAAAAAAARARIAAPADASAHSSLVFDATSSASEALCSGLDSLGFVDESSLMKNTTFIRANSQRTNKNVPTLDSINFFFNRPARLRRLLGTGGARVDALGGYITSFRIHHSRFRGRFIIPLAPDAPTPVEPRRLAEGFHPLQRPVHKTLTRQSNRPHES